ncbi:protein-glutamate O-methyltransferase [Kiloniella laminariae]|uniref:Chemotaxis protein methyltransferase n=1 Tax=Kiloniella laminariae TaxID=454162 RepID=A0ABT4LME6_9PROT|nr:protein-glutamate O-methyltransferase [Kiloniella laminariae]MCZ4282281.1 protein-glutamate O-methyltransferase [Kiloniella laminariae]
MTAPESLRKREFPFTDKDFKTLTSMVYQQTGIVLKESKKDMVYARLARRLRSLGLSSFREYLDLLEGNQGNTEIGMLINAITTNLTKFFREAHHFRHLYQACLAITSDQLARGLPKRLRIWSAGCSSGEEPYSIAIIMNELMKKTGPVDVRILATDLDTRMLQTGMEGEYSHKAIEDMPRPFRSRYTREHAPGYCTMNQELRKLITFKQLNLMAPWPMKGPFDAIFCRNVMIYFDHDTKLSLTGRFSEKLGPGKWLYIGHSESLSDNRTDLVLIGQTIHQRV